MIWKCSMERLTAAVVAALAATVLMTAPAAADDGCLPVVASVPVHRVIHPHVPGKPKIFAHRRHVHRINIARHTPAHPHRPVPAAPPVTHVRVSKACPKALLMSTRVAPLAPGPRPPLVDYAPRPPVTPPPPIALLGDPAPPLDGLGAGPTGVPGDGVLPGGGVTDNLTGGSGLPLGGPGTDPSTPSIPEPATWLMMIVGFFGAGAALRSARGRRAVKAG
jgi:hypothetical protein